MKLPAIGKNPALTIICLAAAGALFGAALAMSMPGSAKASLSFTVAQQSRQATSDYAYDGYYGLRAAELVSDTLISWLAAPSVVKEIYAESGHPISDKEALSVAGRSFRAKKSSSQNVIVSFSASDESTSADLAASTSKILSERAERLVLSADGASLFDVSASAPVIAEAGVEPRAAGFAGLIVGAFAGLLIAYFSAAKREENI